MLLSVPRKQRVLLECFQFYVSACKWESGLICQTENQQPCVIVLFLNRCVFCSTSIRNRGGEMKEFEGFCAEGKSFSRVLFSAMNM